MISGSVSGGIRARESRRFSMGALQSQPTAAQDERGPGVEAGGLTSGPLRGGEIRTDRRGRRGLLR